MGTYHVVCHDCAEEGIFEDEAAARGLQDAHEETTNHRVSCMEIGPPPLEAGDRPDHAA